MPRESHTHNCLRLGVGSMEDEQGEKAKGRSLDRQMARQLRLLRCLHIPKISGRKKGKEEKDVIKAGLVSVAPGAAPAPPPPTTLHGHPINLPSNFDNRINGMSYLSTHQEISQ